MSQVASMLQIPTGESIRRGVDAEPSTRTISDVVEDAGHLKNVTKLLVDNVQVLHQSADPFHSDALEQELQRVANRRAKMDLAVLLDELSDLGFSWRAIARTAQVSVPALRKWRLGESATGENRKRVATMVALCDIARDAYLVDDVAGWLETPLLPDAPVTGLDLLAAGRFSLVLRLASDRGENPETALDEHDPEWRERYESSVEVFTAPDGLPGIRLAEQ